MDSLKGGLIRNTNSLRPNQFKVRDEAFPCPTISKVTPVTLSNFSLYNFWRMSINVRSYEIWTTSRWWYVWNSDFKFAMTCKASERVLSNFKTTLSWLGARSYVVMLSEFWRIVWFAGNRDSVELWVDWIYPSWFELELQLYEALNSSEFMLGPCREAVCFNIRICSWRYFVYIELGELLYWERYEESWLNPS